MLAAERHREDFGLEPPAGARVAELRRHVGLEPVADEFAFAVRREAFEVRQDAFERTRDRC